jgi:hypothetical protein
MANPTVTYTFVNGNVADASQVNQNFTDLINSLTDGSKSLNIDALTAAGAATLNGNVTLGNAVGDAITVNGAFAGTGGDGSATQKGLVTTAAQSFAGLKTFNDGLKLDDAAGQSTLNFYQEDDTSFASVAWLCDVGSGLSSAIAVKITRIGRLVTLTFPSTKTADPSGVTTYLQLTTAAGGALALPTWARPASERDLPFTMWNNSALEVGQLYITVAGVINLYRMNGIAYTNGTNVAGSSSCSATYTI